MSIAETLCLHESSPAYPSLPQVANDTLATLSPFAKNPVVPLDNLLSLIKQLSGVETPDEQTVTTLVHHQLTGQIADKVNSCDQSPLISSVFPPKTINVHITKIQEPLIKVMSPLVFEKNNKLTPEEATIAYGGLREITLTKVRIATGSLKDTPAIPATILSDVNFTNQYHQCVQRFGDKLAEMTGQLVGSLNLKRGVLSFFGIQPRYEINYDKTTHAQLSAAMASFESILGSYLSNPVGYL